MYKSDTSFVNTSGENTPWKKRLKSEHLARFKEQIRRNAHTSVEKPGRIIHMTTSEFDKLCEITHQVEAAQGLRQQIEENNYHRYQNNNKLFLKFHDQIFRKKEEFNYRKTTGKQYTRRLSRGFTRNEDLDGFFRNLENDMNFSFDSSNKKSKFNVQNSHEFENDRNLSFSPEKIKESRGLSLAKLRERMMPLRRRIKSEKGNDFTNTQELPFMNPGKQPLIPAPPSPGIKGSFVRRFRFLTVQESGD
eukprot:TRINITY_DN25257_c0_g1_i1.p1 TRINITY_DN25257_c0_g1~~TRINITY_DN25257_c0_g1_i1.p1  ORF type:complete len:248 (-),score=26.91 TRINITY_DN25257_c0_g1_i1:119-862(-)